MVAGWSERLEPKGLEPKGLEPKRLEPERLVWGMLGAGTLGARNAWCREALDRKALLDCSRERHQCERRDRRHGNRKENGVVCMIGGLAAHRSALAIQHNRNRRDRCDRSDGRIDCRLGSGEVARLLDVAQNGQRLGLRERCRDQQSRLCRPNALGNDGLRGMCDGGQKGWRIRDVWDVIDNNARRHDRRSAGIADLRRSLAGRQLLNTGAADWAVSSCADTPWAPAPMLATFDTLRASAAAFEPPTGACRSAHPTVAPDGTSAALAKGLVLWSNRAAAGYSFATALSDGVLAGPGLQAHFHQGLSGTTSQALTTPWRGLEDQRS